jgi:hypothetical protein
MDVKYPEVDVQLTGTDSNGFMLVATVSTALRRAKVPAEEIAAFRKEATSGDYDHLLQTCMATVNVS